MVVEVHFKRGAEMTGWEKAHTYEGQGGWRAFALALIVAVAVATMSAGSGAQGQPSELVGVASVTDGDTIEIHGTAIRLNGFDAPESGRRCGAINVGQQSALALSDFIGTQTVHCALTGARSRGRYVATCSVGGIDVGDHMVEQGWGRDWPRYSHGAYADEEARARTAHRGVWGVECPANLWGRRNYSTR